MTESVLVHQRGGEVAIAGRRSPGGEILPKLVLNRKFLQFNGSEPPLLSKIWPFLARGFLPNLKNRGGFIHDKKIEGGSYHFFFAIFLLRGRGQKNVFCGFAEKYFGANGLSPGVSGSDIAYFEKNHAPKARDFFLYFSRGVFFLDKKPEMGVLAKF